MTRKIKTQTHEPIQLRPQLRSYIKKVDLAVSHSKHNITCQTPSFADGLPGLLYQQGTSPVYLDREQTQLGNCLLYGQTVEPVKFLTSGSLRMIVIYLYPHAVKQLFGIDAHELKDHCIDVSMLQIQGTGHLSEQLLNIENIDGQLTFLLNYLETLISKTRAGVPLQIMHATDSLMYHGGAISLKKLQDEINLTEKTFQRKFRMYVGVSPKQYQRICRFRKALNQLNANNFSNLTELAYDNGYTDQSHFTRNFKEFTGINPYQYLMELERL